MLTELLQRFDEAIQAYSTAATLCKVRAVLCCADALQVRVGKDSDVTQVCS